MDMDFSRIINGEFCLYNIRKKTMIFLNDKSFLSSFQHMHTCMITTEV